MIENGGQEQSIAQLFRRKSGGWGIKNFLDKT